MKIQISNEDIKLSTSSPYNCVLARAIVRQTKYKHPHVQPTYIYLEDDESVGVRTQSKIKLSPEAIALVKAFDMYEKIEPTEIELDIPRN